MNPLRCDGCGNKTRFDVYETKRTKTFHHFSLGGDDTVEEEEVFETQLEKIVCRWCGASDRIVEGDQRGAPSPPGEDLHE